MSVDSNNQWMVAVSTADLVSAVRAGKVHVASFYGHMQGRRMSRPVFDDLIEALACNTTLRVLDLDHNEVGRWPDGLSTLLGSLQHISTLQQLNLNSCCISDAGVAVLCSFLAENTTLTSLWLYGNRITVRGATALHRTLVSRNGTLRTLNLRNNGLPPHLLEALVYLPLRGAPLTAKATAVSEAWEKTGTAAERRLDERVRCRASLSASPLPPTGKVSSELVVLQRPRPLTLLELCRLRVMEMRVPYKKGAFPPINDDWHTLLTGDEDLSGAWD